MENYHYGSGDQVRGFGTKLKNQTSNIKDLCGNANNALKKMQNSMEDEIYDEAEEIVKNVTKILYDGLEDIVEVIKKLNAYGDFLDSM